MVEPPTLLSLRAIERRFANGTRALRGASLDIHAGEVHGLLGANGAGKSTMVRILAGADRPDGGAIMWRGAAVRWSGPLAARRAGIATIYQHAPLAPALSARENVLLGEDGWARHALADVARVDAIAAMLGHPFDPDAPVASLSAGAQRMVAIAQALASGAELVVMDEPTAALNEAERSAVHAVIRQLAHQQGKAVVLVSHFLDEICALTDRVTVLRDGVVSLTAPTSSLDLAALAAAITGRTTAVAPLPHEPGQAPQDAALEAIDLAGDGLGPLSLRLGQGEILGLAGLLGSGRSRLLTTLFGATPRHGGTILAQGQPLAPGIAAALANGIALVPESRDRQALFGDRSIAWNLSLPPQAGQWRTDARAEAARAEAAIARLGIRAAGPHVAAGQLSGGNAQKVAIAKWLRPETRVLLLDEPTAGMDVGARADVLALVRRLARDGMSVIMASSDFDELLAHCDRIVVMHKGRLVGEAAPGRHDKADLLLMASIGQEHAA